MAAQPPVTLVLAPDPAAAEFARSRLSERLRARAAPGRRPRVRRLRGWLGGGPRALWARLALANPPGVLVVEADLAGWAALAAERPDRFAPVWLRPGLLEVRDALAHTWRGVGDLAWRELLAFDADLEGMRRLPLEALCAAGADADAAIDAAMGLEPAPPGAAPASSAPAGASAYAHVLHALAPPHALGGDLHTVYAPVGAGTHPTVLGGSGARLLGQGWCAPESQSVWNEGRLSTLVVPAEPAGRGWIARVGGFLANHPERTTTVTARLAGAVLDSAQRLPGQRPEFNLTLLLPPSPTGEPQVVELAFDGIVRPEEVGYAGDSRALACALREIRLETRSARRQAPQRTGAARPADSAEAGPEPGAGLAGDPALREVLDEAELGPVLVIASDAAAADAAAAACADREVRRVHAEAAEALHEELEAALGELHALGERVALVLLADVAASSAWFAATAEEVRAGVSDTPVALATGDPDLCPPEFARHDAQRPRRVEVSDRLTVRRR